jgi:hypothetical protein
MKYNNFRQRGISISEANKILKLLKDLDVKIIFVSPYESIDLAKKDIKDFNYSKYAIVKECQSNLWIETKYYEPKNRATRYICELNGELETGVKGLQAFQALQKYCFRCLNARNYTNIDLSKWITEEGKYACSAGPIVGYNPKYEKMELHNVYEYDINSAYSSIMLEAVPDINNPKINVKLKHNQVGFLIDEDLTMMDKPGLEVDVAFDLVQLSKQGKEFILRLYNEKETAETKEERAAAKLKLNAAIGYYQRYNPFLRAYIVHSCNKRIKALLDDDSVLWNTDAIFSLKQRPELAVGASIGEFEELKIDRFAYIGNNYQINYDLPKYRGIAKAWYKEGFDILKDSLPQRNNVYKFDLAQMKIIKEK